MTFRLLTVHDYAEFLTLIQEFRPTQFTEEEFQSTLHNIQSSSDIWVYEENGKLLATATIMYEYKFIFNNCIYAHIEDVCVRTSHRRQGLGKQLILHLIKQAHNCYKITLDCSKENIPFYEACGLEWRGNQMCQLISNLK